MSNESFVRRAPEIAEEILAKTANLPKDLKSFTRNLFEKEASVETDSLKMPARMTVADLRKIAAGNKVDLPKIASVKAEEYGSVADELKKIAARHAEETRDDVLAAAVTILEKDAAKGGIPRRAPAPRAPAAPVGSGIAPKPHGFFKRLFGGEQTQAEYRRFKALEAAEEAKIPGTAAHAAQQSAESLGLKPKAEAEAIKQGPELRRQLISALPMTGLALGVPVAAGVAMSGRKDRDGESVKIYK